ncbi:hypothetical protein GHT06_022197 [Daphnia sinensis]|uniref:Uncharacterized protein n=1 Tax=Daphnia sinensis TaxID=1820382 RepID=A0AAD5KXG0_9CRUS|nr:hypothetical protein GHT06_022197 [Daphnia sinensis]
MGGGNSVPVPPIETASPLPTRNTRCESDATDGDTPAIQLENEYLATVNALQDRLDVLERLVLVQHRSEDVLQQKIEVIKKLRDMAKSLQKNPHMKVVIATTTTTSTDIPSAYRGTPTATTKTAPTKAFLVTDVIQVVRICNEIGETPIAGKLRKMGTDFED